MYHLITELAKPQLGGTPYANIGLTSNESHATTMDVWHRRLCHRTLDDTSVKNIASRVEGLEISDADIPSSKVCGICTMGREHKEVATKVREKATEILQVVHSDLCGPMQTVGLSGERYFITFIDETGGRVSLSLLRTKDQALATFQAYRARAEKSSEKEIKAFRTDGGGEYVNTEFKIYLEDAGIELRISTPYSPTQNGRAERANRTIMENAHCILQDSQLGNEFWRQGVLTAGHIHNRLPSRSHNNRSPLEYWTRKLPGVGHLRIFGSTTWVHVPKERRQKLDPKSVKCILVGYEENAGTKIYRLYDAEKKRFLASRDVIIDESSTPMQPQEPSASTIGWGKGTLTPALEKEEPSASDFRPLDSIIPPLSQPATGRDMRDRITVRPPLPPLRSPTTQQLSPAVPGSALPQVSCQPRRS